MLTFNDITFIALEGKLQPLLIQLCMKWYCFKFCIYLSYIHVIVSLMVEIHPLDRPSTRKYYILIIYLILFWANREIDRVARKSVLSCLSTRKDFPVGLMQYKDFSLLVNDILIIVNFVDNPTNKPLLANTEVDKWAYERAWLV